MPALKNRYEFIVYFDVKNGNPNGDPDAGNMPRIDQETGLGLVTDVCLKRKIRDYVETVKEDADGYRIYIKKNVPLNRSDNEAFEAVGISGAAEMEKKQFAQAVKDAKSKMKKEKGDGNDGGLDALLRDYMCSQFFDIRTFGAVMTTMVKGALNCGQVRGPVQLSFAQSVDPIITQEVSITRVAITTESDAENKKTEMGNKYIVPYGLYRCEGYVSANLARKTTGFSEDDLELLWDAIINMFEYDRSAARGQMATRKLIIFKHDSELGNAPAHKLFDLVTAKKKEGVDAPRDYTDYEISIEEGKLPEGVICEVRD
ncbi:MAG: type I-C CRISPR-associated protein Cas7/Csd2 [Lachnospiraceae bacterium]|nr:type I-C CRISPR-associated protein Cas7/Csd2 [Lachnospiraceae bacterium]